MVGRLQVDPVLFCSWVCARSDGRRRSRNGGRRGGQVYHARRPIGPGRSQLETLSVLSWTLGAESHGPPLFRWTITRRPLSTRTENSRGWSLVAETAQSLPSACDSLCSLIFVSTAVCLTLHVNCWKGCFRSRVTHATTTLFLTWLSGESFHSGSNQSTHHRSVLPLVRWVSEISLPVSARPRARPETFSFPARERTLRTRTRTLTR